MTKHIEGLEKVIVVLNDNNKYEIKVYWNEKLGFCTIESNIDNPNVALKIKKAYQKGLYDGKELSNND